MIYLENLIKEMNSTVYLGIKVIRFIVCVFKKRERYLFSILKSKQENKIKLKRKKQTKKST